jgi:DNA-binding response OmpR family regulator
VAVERPSAVTVLIVDDEVTTRDLCREVVVDAGLRTRTASTTEQALDILEQLPVDIVITDLRLPQIGGLGLLQRIRETYPQTAVIVLTQYGTIENAVEATRMGAADYVTKPFHVPELRGKLDRVVRSLEIDQENRVLREQLRTRPGFGGLIGVSPHRIPRVARLAVSRQAVSRGGIETRRKSPARFRGSRRPGSGARGCLRRTGHRIDNVTQSSNYLIMDVAAKPAVVSTERSPLLGVADAVVAQRLEREVERIATVGPATVASSLLQLRQFASRVAPQVILLDYELVEGAPLAEALRPLTAVAPVVLLAPIERQEEAARLVAGGEVDFVARAGDFVSIAAALIERRLRWAAMSESLLGPPWAELHADLGEVFRHEINNPLTGILGNAELLLAHRDRLSAVDTQRLQTVVDLAVRLRETIRRLSSAWENRSRSLKSG